MPRLSPAMRARLRCPACGHELAGELPDGDGVLGCDACAARFPIVNGVPILIDGDRSVFTVGEAMAHGPMVFDASSQRGWRDTLRRVLPRLDLNTSARRNVEMLGRLLHDRAAGPAALLVVGGGRLGHGMSELVADARIDVVESDVSLGPRASVVFDAHDVPFTDATFDGVVLQAVLEHVVSPERCVEEVWRVLKPEGIVYAETAFLQQVHGGRYDFTRYTLLGHRRLFRSFEEIESGVAVGPGSALAWSWSYFLASFCRTPRWKPLMHAVGRLTGFWWKWFDGILAQRAGSLDAASGVYFLGRKGPIDWALSDRDLVASYRGVHH